MSYTFGRSVRPTCSRVHGRLCYLLRCLYSRRSGFGVVRVSITRVGGSMLSVVVRHALHAHAFGISSTLQAGFSLRFLCARGVTRISPNRRDAGETHAHVGSWRHAVETHCRVERPRVLAPRSASPRLNGCPFLLIPVKPGRGARPDLVVACLSAAVCRDLCTLFIHSSQRRLTFGALHHHYLASFFHDRPQLLPPSLADISPVWAHDDGRLL